MVSKVLHLSLPERQQTLSKRSDLIARETYLPNNTDLNEWLRGASARPFDLQLGALHVELSAALEGFVEADVLGADEVLAGRDVLRDGELQAVLLPAAPVAVGARVAAAEAGLVDLEPVARAVVRVNRAGCLRHVDEAGAGVLDYCALLLAGNFILFGFFLSFFCIGTRHNGIFMSRTY